MSNIKINKNVDVEIELTREEKEVLIQSCKILHRISKDMWDNDVDDTEVFDRVYETKECLIDFLRRDIGVEVDQKGEIIYVSGQG